MSNKKNSQSSNDCSEKNADLSHKHSSTFESIPSGLPSLVLAEKLQKACAKVGFDWPDALPVLDKVKEEVVEIEQAMDESDPRAIEEEIGDALFALVNLARHHNIDADNALRKASHKFKSRFEKIEDIFDACERQLESASLAELEDAWQTVKKTSH